MGAFYEVELKRNPELTEKAYSTCTSLSTYDLHTDLPTEYTRYVVNKMQTYDVILPKWEGPITPLTDIEDQCFGPIDWCKLPAIALNNPVIAEKFIYAGRTFSAIVDEHRAIMRKTHNYPAPLPLIYRFISMKQSIDDLVAKEGDYMTGTTSLPYRVLASRKTYDILFDTTGQYAAPRMWDDMVYVTDELPRIRADEIPHPEEEEELVRPPSPAAIRRKKRAARRQRRRKRVALARTFQPDPKKKETCYINVCLAIRAHPSVAIQVSEDDQYLPTWLKMDVYDVTSTPAREELEKLFRKK
jgi:hypothetical protein